MAPDVTTRRSFLVAATLGPGVVASHLRAAVREKVARVGIVYPEPPGGADARRGWAAFNEALRERGWEEGRNIVFERRYFHGDRARLPGLMAELIALDVDVLFVQGVWAVVAAKQATSRIPIVFAVGDAVGRGVVANLARPEGNVTGVSNRVVEISHKVIELLSQVSPGISRVATLWNTALGYPPAMLQYPHSRGIEIFIVDFKGPDDLVSACATVMERRADAVLVPASDERFQSDFVNAIAKLRLPAAWPGREFVRLGGLLSLTRDIAYNFRRLAVYLDNILHGVKPADLPVEQPAVYELAINLGTAKALGITIPRDLLVRADWIIE